MTSDTFAAVRDDRARLRELVDVWLSATHDVLRLLEDLDDGDWTRPTDLPGWDVKAVAAHLAHLESELAGMPQEQVEVPAAPHVRNVMGQFTEVGPAARRDWPVARIVEELRTAVETRAAQLRDDPPSDLGATGPSFAALAGWSWETLLNNRPLDFWMHEQDIRRAVGRPGGLDTPAAAHVGRLFALSLPMVVGKKAGARPGQSVVLQVVDAPDGVPTELSVQVGDDGRARPVDAPDRPTVTIRLAFADWMRRCGGRCTPDAVDVEITGDRELGERVVDGLAVTI